MNSSPSPSSGSAASGVSGSRSERFGVNPVVPMLGAVPGATIIGGVDAVAVFVAAFAAVVVPLRQTRLGIGRAQHPHDLEGCREDRLDLRRIENFDGAGRRVGAGDNGGCAEHIEDHGRDFGRHLDDADIAVGILQQSDEVLEPLGGRLDRHRGAADADRRDRRDDVHLAGRGHIARDHHEEPLDKRERGVVVAARRIVDQFVDHHAGVFGEQERGRVDEGDRDAATARGLDHVTLIDRRALIETDPCPVRADGPGLALDAVDRADRLLTVARKLRVLTRRERAGQPSDQVSLECGAIAEQEGGRFGLREVVANHELLAPAGLRR